MLNTKYQVQALEHEVALLKDQIEVLKGIIGTLAAVNPREAVRVEMPKPTVPVAKRKAKTRNHKGKRVPHYHGEVPLTDQARAVLERKYGNREFEYSPSRLGRQLYKEKSITVQNPIQAINAISNLKGVGGIIITREVGDTRFARLA